MRCLRGGRGEAESMSGNRKNGASTSLILRGAREMEGCSGGMGFPGGASGKEATCQCRRQETWVRSLDWKDPLEGGMMTHFSILAWRILWTEKPGGYSSRSCKDLDTTEVTEHTQACSRRIEHLMRGFELNLELIEK